MDHAKYLQKASHPNSTSCCCFLCGAIFSHWYLSVHKSPCSELFWILWVQSALESAYSQTKIILTGALSSVLFEIFRILSYFETKGYFSFNLLKMSLGSRLLLLNNWNLFTVQCCFLVLCVVATVKFLLIYNS